VSEIAAMYQLVIVLSLTSALAAATSARVAQLEAAHPPAGQFVEVRACSCMLSPSAWRASPPPDPVVVLIGRGNFGLIHGEWKLEDMRLALAKGSPLRIA
jgi:hypothetical protein